MRYLVEFKMTEVTWRSVYVEALSEAEAEEAVRRGEHKIDEEQVDDLASYSIEDVQVSEDEEK